MVRPSSSSLPQEHNDTWLAAHAGDKMCPENPKNRSDDPADVDTGNEQTVRVMSQR